MSKTPKSVSIKEGLEQVRKEVDSWPLWMKTNEAVETVRQTTGKTLSSQNIPGKAIQKT